jgi:hypothetical protein
MPTSVVAAVVASTAAEAIGAALITDAFIASASWITYAGTVAVIEAGVGFVVSSGLRAAMGGGAEDSSVSSPGFTAQAQQRTHVIRSTTANRQIIYGQAMVSGPLVFAASSADNTTLHIVVALAGHEVEEIGDIYFNDVLATDSRFAGLVTINKHLGGADQVADADLVAANVGWTAAHRGRGVAYVYIKLTWNRDAFPRGIPNIKAVVKGKKLYDPRTGLTAYSTNWALAVRDYLTAPYGLNASAAEIDDTAIIAAANIADEAVALAAGGTEARYTANGVLDMGQTPRSAMDGLLTAGAGVIVWTAGKYTLHPGAYVSPDVTLDADDLRGPVKVRAKVPRQELYNGVKGTYVDPAKYWQPGDFPPVTNSTYATADGGQIFRDIALPYTTSSATAQRLARLMLEKSRQGITVEMPCKLTAFKVSLWSTVRVTLAQLGWSAKEFKVVGWTFDPAGGVNLALQEESAACYAWSSDETIIDPAPDTNLPNPFTVAAPTGLALASGTNELFVAGDGSVVSRIKASWTALTDAFVTGGGRIQVQFKPSADSDWQDAEPADGAATQTFIAPVEDGTAYDVRVRAENSIGVRGAWATVSNHTVVGKTAAPSNVTGFAAQQQGDAVVFICDPVGDNDLDLVEVRLLDDGDTTWANGIPKANILRGYTVTSAAIPPGTWTFLAKARDTSGNYSDTAARFDLTVSSDGYTAIASVEESPAWSGTITNFVRHWTGVLVPESNLTCDQYGWEVFDQFVPDPCATCTYESAEIDKGIDVPARIWGDIVSVLGPGETTGIANPKHLVDYKLSAGSYDGFEDWTLGTVPFRTMKGKIVLDTAVGVVKITGFRQVIDRQPVTEEKHGLTVGAGGTAIVFDSAFHTTPMIVAHNDGATPLLATHGSDSATGTTLHLFNTSGSDVGGTGGYTATGA